MAHPLEAVRILLGLLALFFSYCLGRVATRLHELHQPFGKAITWALRAVVCLAGVLWARGFDAISIVVFALAAASLAAGVYLELHPRLREEIHLFKN